MKYITTFTAWLLFFIGVAQAQQHVPQKFSYQAVAVDGNGAVLENTPLCIRATILSGSFNGTQEWIEVHPDLATDDFGLFTIDIGDGNPIGGQTDFVDIRWGEFKHYLKIEMSLDANCTNFILVGTNQLLSVPYALYAERAAKADVANTAIYADTALFSNVSNISYYADSSSVANNSYYSNYSDTTLFAMTTINNIGDDDPDPTNEIQDLVLSGTTLTISGSTAPGINLSAFNVADPDSDPTNELQNLALNGSMLSISGSSTPPINLAVLNTFDPDADPTNEIQDLVVSGSTLTISGSSAPGINLAAFNAFDPDADPTNELQNLILNGPNLSISGSSAPPINLTALNAYDPDADPTNELQDLVLNGPNLSISGSNAPPINLTALNAYDPDADPTNELQNLVLNGPNLSITGTNTPPINLTALNAYDPDADPTNELQNLTANGSILTLSGSTAPPVDMNASDPDHDPTNELQNLVLNGPNLSITGSTTPPINLTALNAYDPDHDPTNELQELMFDSITSMLGITNGSFFIDLSSLSNFNASGSDLDFPQGVANTKYVFIPDTYVVPADSVFYVVASEDEMILPGVGFEFGRHLTGPNLPVFKPGTNVDNCRCIGFLKAIDPFFEPVLFVLKPNQANFYQVPFNKNLVVKSGLDQSTPITLNGFTISASSSIIKAFVIPEGIQIKNLGNDEIILSGYLIKS